MDKTVYPLTIKAGETATLNVSDTPKVTDTLIELFKIDMETQKDNPQGNASLAGAEFTWKYYAGFYNKDNLPAEATRTWVTKTIAETDSDGTTHYITKLGDAYKVSGDSYVRRLSFSFFSSLSFSLLCAIIAALSAALCVLIFSIITSARRITTIVKKQILILLFILSPQNQYL